MNAKNFTENQSALHQNPQCIYPPLYPFHSPTQHIKPTPAGPCRTLYLRHHPIPFLFLARGVSLATLLQEPVGLLVVQISLPSGSR